MNVLAPSNRIGIPQNNIASYRRKAAGRTFGEMEAQLTRHGSSFRARAW